VLPDQNETSMTSITLIHYAAPPIVGGVETILGHHARLMADAGHEVRILCGRGEQFDARVPVLVHPLIDSIHPDILACKAELDDGRRPPQFDQLVASISDVLASAVAGARVLIPHNVCSLHKNLPLTAAIWKLREQNHALRVILWHHDLAWAMPRYLPELHPGHPWDLLRRAMPGAIQVAVSDQRQEELAELLGLPRESIAVVPNGIETAQFLKLEQETRTIVQQLQLLDALPLLLLPVRVTPRKNIELALRTLAELRRRYPKAQLVVTGPLGPHNPANLVYMEQLRSLRSSLGLENAAHFLAELTPAYIPDEVISDLYALADALFLPSTEEGFGIPVLEAGLSRLPVICSDIPSLRNLAGPHATYFRLEAQPHAVAEMIHERLQRSPAFGLHSTVKTSFTWERVYSEKIAPLLR